ncbi:ribonuclease 3-like protein 2 [Castanea sativa]|uniref:ribonuclease 3-like protein 2 n=1 Tax=Castanea sativa TaxID=21020 RepID=UPI003F64DAD4
MYNNTIKASKPSSIHSHELASWSFRNYVYGFSGQEASTRGTHTPHPLQNNNNNNNKLRSYQRLEFVGDVVLGLAVSKYLYLEHPSLSPGQLTNLRSANVSNDKLARVAVRHSLHRYIRHNNNLDDSLLDKIEEFVDEVSEEDDIVLHGSIKAPKILADIVESLAAAIYFDLNFDLQNLWVVRILLLFSYQAKMIYLFSFSCFGLIVSLSLSLSILNLSLVVLYLKIFRDLLEPIVTPKLLQQQPRPITTLNEQCQKQGREVDIKIWREGAKHIATVYVDGVSIASGSSDQSKEIAKLNAANQALLESSKSMPTNIGRLDFSFGPNKSFEIEGAEQKLNEVCQKKRWPDPIYRYELLYHEQWRILYINIMCTLNYLMTSLLVLEGVYYTRF